MGRIAFFDVDKCILNVNSATLWVRREYRAGNITTAQALRATFWVGLYHFGYARMEHVLIDAVKNLRGLSERDVIDRTLAFYREEVAQRVKPKALSAIAAHKERGDLIFLLTSSSNYLSAPLGDTLQIDGFLANRFEVHEGRFTGRPMMPFCYGPGKVAHAEVIAEKLRIPLRECVFYTDSYSDVPMLEAVGEPVAVDPDRRLRRHAQKRGWRIERWDEPAPMALPPHST
jgi:HAD superfamily hydrolase (TIGR01490 family)